MDVLKDFLFPKIDVKRDIIRAKIWFPSGKRWLANNMTGQADVRFPREPKKQRSKKKNNARSQVTVSHSVFTLGRTFWLCVFDLRKNTLFFVLIIFRIMTGVELHPRITQSQRANMFGGFFPHSNASGLPSLPRMSIPCYPFAGPYVAIQNRLEIVKVPHEEVWSCVMSPTADGFDIVSWRVMTSKFQWRSFCLCQFHFSCCRWWWPFYLFISKMKEIRN